MRFLALIYLFILITTTTFFYTSCNSSQKNSTLDTSSLANEIPYKPIEIIVTLKSNEDLDIIIADFKEHQLKVVKQLAKTLRIWLVKSETPQVSPKELLYLLSKHKKIKEAQFNRKINDR
jgi:hypothetical protein